MIRLTLGQGTLFVRRLRQVPVKRNLGAFLKFVLFNVLILIVSSSFASIIHIPNDQSTIQSGIDVSINGDTVLVHPGIYYENLNMSEKNITLASLELLTGDNQYVSNTIIDGQRVESCIVLHDIEYGATIQGFTIRNGFGTFLASYDGGGIQIQSAQNIMIKNCTLNNNVSSAGGAIFAVLSEITFSGLRISENSANIGGALYLYYYNTITFDTINLCDIFNNNAGKGSDLFIRETGQIDVIVDTFSVLQPDRYFAEFEENSLYTFNIQNYWMTLEPNDLYVAHDGDDSNSGLSPEDPLKNISWAVRRIEAAAQFPRTIHVANGTYSWEANQQIFPIGCKENVSIIGEDMESTILINDFSTRTLFGLLLNSRIEVSNFTLINNLSVTSESLIYFANSDSVCLTNLQLTNSSNINDIIMNYQTGFDFENIIILNNQALRWSGFYFGQSHGYIKNSRVINNESIQTTGSNTESAFYLYADGDVTIENCEFGNNISYETSSNTIRTGSMQGLEPTFKMINCLIYGNQSNSDRVVYILGEGNNEIINCTFADNSSTNSTIKTCGEITLTNTIMHNNTNYEIYMENESPNVNELNIDYSNLLNGMNGIYNQGQVNVISWNEGNILSDPFFDTSGDFPFTLTMDSPCVDSGLPSIEDLDLPLWDLLHNERVWDGDQNGCSIIDMGCYEFGAPFVISNNYIMDTPQQLNLSNYPNPFNPNTQFSFQLTEDFDVELSIYNIKGQRIKTLINNYMQAGEYVINWNGLNDFNNRVSSGVYFANLNIENKFKVVKKCLLMK